MSSAVLRSVERSIEIGKLEAKRVLKVVKLEKYGAYMRKKLVQRGYMRLDRKSGALRSGIRREDFILVWPPIVKAKYEDKEDAVYEDDEDDPDENAKDVEALDGEWEQDWDVRWCPWRLEKFLG